MVIHRHEEEKDAG